MRHWPLTQGFVAIVDDEDFERLLQLDRSWCVAKRRHTNYAKRFQKDGSRRRVIYMHRWILQAPDGIEVDHISGDGLDNRRENLRLATPRQNSENRTGPTRSASGYRGVRGVGVGSFQAYVNTGNRQISVGCWGTPEEAAAARDLEVIRIGSRARLNFENPPFSVEMLNVSRHELPKPKSGHPGIRFKGGAWETWVRLDGERVYLGRFSNLESAFSAQIRARA